MKNYDFLQKLIFAVLGIYFVVGLSLKAIPSEFQKDIIPFFSWFLYERVPNKVIIYIVRIHEYHGQVFNPPVYFHEAEIIPERTSGKARQLIQRLGNSITHSDEKQTQDLRILFERAYLTYPARYEVGQLLYNPLKRWKEATAEFRSLKEFVANK